MEVRSYKQQFQVDEKTRRLMERIAESTGLALGTIARYYFIKGLKSEFGENYEKGLSLSRVPRQSLEIFQRTG